MTNKKKKKKSLIGWTWDNWEEDFDNDSLIVGGFKIIGIPQIYPKKPRLKNITRIVRITIEEL